MSIGTDEMQVLMHKGSPLNGNSATRQARRRGTSAVRLGDTLCELMESRISQRQCRFGAVAEVWSQVLPSALREHCELVDISGGQLKVRVDSSPYKYELQLCSSELLEELRRQCPQARLTRIKFVVG